MQTTIPTLNSLFDQLGLPSSDSDIEYFIERHKPVGPSERLDELSFFNASQQAFLRESIADDATWAEVIDTLSTLLRQEPEVNPS